MVNVMDKLEKVEKLREKTGVTYEDAKAALEHVTMICLTRSFILRN